jgi:hypothetical protein
MNGAKAVRKHDISEAAARGACPVCTVLRHRQTQLIEANGIPSAAHLCNFHAWSIARSAPASAAAAVFLQTLRAHQGELPHAEAHRCDFCDLLKQEEEGRLQELVEKMREPAFLDWMRIHGTLCLRHAHQAYRQLPAPARPVIPQLLSRTADGLEQDLEEYAKHAQHGDHAGGGVLGRAAEFLVSQRGIPGEETPC